MKLELVLKLIRQADEVLCARGSHGREIRTYGAGALIPERKKPVGLAKMAVWGRSVTCRPALCKLEGETISGVVA